MRIEQAIVLTVCLTVSPGGLALVRDAAAQAPRLAGDNDDRARLQGGWKVVKVRVNGREAKDRGFSDATFTFWGDELTIASPREAEERHTFVLERSSEPRAINIKRIKHVREQPVRMIYDRSGLTLKIGFNDALQGRPRNFEPSEHLTVLDLTHLADPSVTAPASARIVAHNRGCWFALFSPDGKTLPDGKMIAIACEDGSFTLQDLSRMPVATLTLP